MPIEHVSLDELMMYADIALLGATIEIPYYIHHNSPLRTYRAIVREIDWSDHDSSIDSILTEQLTIWEPKKATWNPINADEYWFDMAWMPAENIFGLYRLEGDEIIFITETTYVFLFPKGCTTIQHYPACRDEYMKIHRRMQRSRNRNGHH